MPHPAIRVRPFAPARYVETLEAMRQFTQSREPGTPDQLWMVEHEPVYTLGLAGRREHLLDPGDVAIVHTERGGQVTYHGPGQVVAYPLMDLRRLRIGVKELVYRYEQALIQTLAGLGIDGRRLAGAPGIYVPLPGGAGAFAGVAKIAALGVRIMRGCSFHGLALNVRVDLGAFERINPCGYAGLRSVDLACLGVEASSEEVAKRLSERLVAHLSWPGSARL
ncbi:MAG: lipoyl(octanoyl) transferase LipB [Betaproteobacteria bacterium]